MSNSCVLNPRIKSGEISPLFTRLKNFLGNKKLAEDLYYKTLNPEFKKLFPKVRYDNNEEPLFEDVLVYCGVLSQKNEGLLESLNAEFGTKPYIKSISSVSSLQSQASSFNANNPLSEYFTAVVDETENGVYLRIVNKDSSHKDLSNKQKFNSELNNKLLNLMHSWGVDVGVLTDLEEKLGVNGILDLDVAMNTATGLKEVIRVAKGVKGEQALAEEWGHFVVEAVKDNPLKDRMLNTLKNTEVLEAILGDNYQLYSETYNGDIDTLAKEALGKLMAQYLNNYEVNSPNTNLFNRFKEHVLKFFRKHNTSDIDDLIDSVINDVYEFTTKVLNDEYKLNVSGKEYKTKLYSLDSSISRDKKILENIIIQEEKRLSIYGEGAKATAGETEKTKMFDEKQKIFIEQLKYNLDNHKELDAIYLYLDSALQTLKLLSSKLDKIPTSEINFKEKFSTLRNIRNYMSSYVYVMDYLSSELGKASNEGDNRLKDKLSSQLVEFFGLSKQLGNDWIRISKDEFAKFLKPFEGESISMYIRGERKEYNIRELLDYTEQDISFIEKWTDAMADSTDPILRIYDSLVKNKKDEGRQNTISINKELAKEAKILEDSGVSDTEFMYERNREGKLSGRFVTKYNWADFGLDMKAYRESLGDIDNDEKQRLVGEWKKANTDKYGNPISKYLSSQYSEIQKNPAKKRYYNYIISLKKKQDLNLPAKYVSYSRAPQIRRDLLERAMSGSNVGKYIWESMKDGLVRREDDTEFSYTKQDFEGNQIYNLPIYYTRKLEDINDLSTDCTSCMMAYVSMAQEYNAMENIVDALEVGRDILKERDYAQTSGGKIKQEFIKKVPRVLTTKGEISNAMHRLNDFMTMQVYGEQMKDEGTIFGMDVGKLANMLNKVQSYSTTALSLLTGTANLVQNTVLSNIEALSEQYFGKKDMAKADLEYGKMLPEYLGELGNRIKVSKMALFAEKFNVLQDYKQSVKGINWDRKSWFTRALKEDTLFFTTSAGDHYTQMRTALALANRYQLIDSNNNPISLFDALEVKYIDESHPEYGAELIFKEGVKDPDGKPLDSDFITRFTKKVRGVNNKLYGIYNQDDKNAMQYRAFGRLLMLYRNWMRPLLLKRYGVERYNYDTDSFEVGYYRVLYNFLSNTIKDIKNKEFDIIKQWKSLNSSDKSGIMRAFSELATYWALFAVIASLKAEPDDDEAAWLKRYANYTITRLRADLGALLPTPDIIDESLRLIDNPFAAVRVLKNTRQLLYLFNPDTWTDEVESGIYKGFTKAEKILIQPLPFVRQFINAYDPDEPAKWFKAQY